MKYFIELSYINDENPVCWLNFKENYSYMIKRWHETITNDLKRDYNAKMNFKDEKNTTGPILEFDNKEDMVRFLLMWS